MRFDSLLELISRAGLTNFLAGVLAALALISPLGLDEPYPVVLVGVLIFPLACIWFGEAMGDFAGGTRIKRSSAAPVVRLVGWLFLLPIAAGTVAISCTG